MSEYIVNRACDDYDIGSLRHAAFTGATQIRFTVPQVTLFAPITFPENISVEIIGYTGAYGIATSILNYGLIFPNANYVDVKSLTFSNIIGDGIQFNHVNVGKVSHCFFLDAVDNSDEAISAVKGCGNIEVSLCGFWNLKKCILLGTGDGTDYLQDKNTIVSIYNNIFYANNERRYPYGTGKVAFSGNWVLGWKYKGVQSFGFRLRQGGKGMLYNNFISQENDRYDGWPSNPLSNGGADQAVTVEDDATVLLAGTNTFDPSSWLIRTNNGANPIFTPDEMNQMLWYQGDMASLKQYLTDNIGPKPF